MIELESPIGADPRSTRARPRGADCAGRGHPGAGGWSSRGLKAHVWYQGAAFPGHTTHNREPYHTKHYKAQHKQPCLSVW